MPQEPLPASWVPLVPTLPSNRAWWVSWDVAVQLGAQFANDTASLPPAGMTRGEGASCHGWKWRCRLPPGVARDPPSPRQPAGHRVGTIPAALPHWARTLRAGSDLPKARWEEGARSARWPEPRAVCTGARPLICGGQGPLSSLSAVGIPCFQVEVAGNHAHIYGALSPTLLSLRRGEPPLRGPESSAVHPPKDSGGDPPGPEALREGAWGLDPTQLLTEAQDLGGRGEGRKE